MAQQRGLGPTARLGGTLLALGLLFVACRAEVYEERFAEDEIDIYDDLYAATAVGSDHLWTAGYFGAIYRTRDGGENWQKLQSHTEKSLFDISFADKQSGWAVGRRGYVIHTADGGDTWTRQEIPRHPPQHIFSVDAIDREKAWAVGEWGGRYYTRDGGVSWEDRSFLMDETHPAWEYLTDFELERYRKGEKLYDDIYLNDIHFVDEMHGWMVGEYGYTWYTEDGGETWEKGRIIGDVSFDDIYFEPDEAEIPKERWDKLFSAAEVLLERQYLRVRIEAFVTRAELEERGDTFLADERAGKVQEFLEGEGITQDRLKIVNRTPYDQESVDMAEFERKKIAPKPVVKIEVMETPFLFDVKFRDDVNGVISGLGGVVLRSSDGGRTWRYADTGTNQALFSIAFGGANVVAVGEKGLARMSLDDAATFRPPAGEFPKLFGYMRDVVFGERDRGWIVGAGGTVLRSSDGGRTWSQVLPPADSGMRDDGVGE